MIQIRMQSRYVSYTDYCNTWDEAIWQLSMYVRAYKHMAVRLDKVVIVDLW